jgi:hypothetical protein
MTKEHMEFKTACSKLTERGKRRGNAGMVRCPRAESGMQAKSLREKSERGSGSHGESGG